VRKEKRENKERIGFGGERPETPIGGFLPTTMPLL
jgi:hypothetical protein